MHWAVKTIAGDHIPSKVDIQNMEAQRLIFLTITQVFYACEKPLYITSAGLCCKCSNTSTCSFYRHCKTQDWSLVWNPRTLNTTRECSTGSKKQIHDMQSNKNQQIVLDLEPQPEAAGLAMPGGSEQARHTWIKMHVPVTQPVLAGLGWVQPQTDCLQPEAGNWYKTLSLS